MIVNRAAVGLAAMGDRSAIVPLMEALVTMHKFQINTSADAGTGGGGGMPIGATFGKPTTKGGYGRSGWRRRQPGAEASQTAGPQPSGAGCPGAIDRRGQLRLRQQVLVGLVEHTKAVRHGRYPPQRRRRIAIEL